jgi:hypothetical protein
METPKDKKFDLEHQYQLYLKRMGLSEPAMHTQQKKQLRQAFYGSAGQLLILMRDDIASLPEDEGVVIFDDLMKQVFRFFIAETTSKN